MRIFSSALNGYMLRLMIEKSSLFCSQSSDLVHEYAEDYIVEKG